MKSSGYIMQGEGAMGGGVLGYYDGDAETFYFLSSLSSLLDAYKSYRPLQPMLVESSVGWRLWGCKFESFRAVNGGNQFPVLLM